MHQTFYLSTVFFIFVFVMALQVPKLNASDNLKMISFVCWAAYGVIPTCHWVKVMGGWENPIVAVSGREMNSPIHRLNWPVLVRRDVFRN